VTIVCLPLSVDAYVAGGREIEFPRRLSVVLVSDDVCRDTAALCARPVCATRSSCRDCAVEVVGSPTSCFLFCARRSARLAETIGTVLKKWSTAGRYATAAARADVFHTTARSCCAVL